MTNKVTMLLTIAVVVCLPAVYSQHDREIDMNRLFPVDGFNFNGPAFRSSPGSGSGRTTTSLPTPPPPTQSPAAQTTTIHPVVASCLRECIATTEYNPVCGSDGILYDNPGKLTCAQTCGKDVQLVRFGRCASGSARG